MEKEIAKRFMKGISASPGIVIGKACVFQDILLRVEKRLLGEGHAEQEVARFKQALREVTGELMEDYHKLAQRIGKREAEIFQQLKKLLDSFLLSMIA